MIQERGAQDRSSGEVSRWAGRMVARVRDGGPFQENKDVQTPRTDLITNSRFLHQYRRSHDALLHNVVFTLGTYKPVNQAYMGLCSQDWAAASSPQH